MACRNAAECPGVLAAAGAESELPRNSVGMSGANLPGTVSRDPAVNGSQNVVGYCDLP